MNAPYSFLEEDKKKILVFDHVTFSKDCAESFKSLGFDVIYKEIGSIEEIITLVHTESPTYLFSINFHPVLMEVAREMEVPYIAWIVDSPYYALFYEQVRDSSVYLFVYDEIFADRLKKMGYSRVYYLPPAANVKRLCKNKGKEIAYSCNVSFIGSTGDDNEYNQFSLASKLGPELVKELESLFQKQQENEEVFLFRELVTDGLVQKISQALGAEAKEEGLMSTREKMAYILARKYNEYRRKDLLIALSESFEVAVWGDMGWRKIENDHLRYMGYAEHFEELPKICRASKINLNQTRVYVDAGLPMRVFDVLGSQGFLATNRTQDIDRYFENGKDLVVYQDNKELKDLVGYYLSHEKERAEIAKNGFEKISRLHTFDLRLEKMMQLVEKHEG